MLNNSTTKINKWLNIEIDNNIQNKHIIKGLYNQLLNFLENKNFTVIDEDNLRKEFYILLYKNSI